jgi:hypothetical protein
MAEDKISDTTARHSVPKETSHGTVHWTVKTYGMTVFVTVLWT